MKIAISCTGETLDSAIDPRFGRSAIFIIYDMESGNFEAIKNPNVNAGGGAGIQTAQMIADKGVKVVLTGNVGPNASRTLEMAKIKVVTGVTGTVQSAIDGYK